MNRLACRRCLRYSFPRVSGQRGPDQFLKCFGVGDGMPCGDRNHASFFYRLRHAGLLVDCGEPISLSYKASGLSYEAIDRIFISHLHADHIGGFLMLVQSFWLERRRKDLRVHLPADGIEPLRALLRAAYLFDEVLPFRLIFEPLRRGQAVTLAGLRVTPHATTHLEGWRKSFQKKYPGEFVAYSFLLETKSLRIGHSADLGAVEDLAPLLARPLELLVCELAHFEPEKLFRYLKGRAIGQIVFTHLGRLSWERRGEIQRLAGKILSGARFRFPGDQEVVAL